ncbi:MAG: type II secretion system minor pseudopilin GspK [Granulosicoccus sp.]
MTNTISGVANSPAGHMRFKPGVAQSRRAVPEGRQRGVAIITAMLVIALGTISMVAITSSQQLDMQRERNEGLIQQARALGSSGERFAAALLFRDFQAAQRSNSDSLDDDWAQTIPPVPIDNASIQGCIVDMQGKFNLNNLVNPDGVVQPNYVTQFKKLLEEVNIDPLIADAVVDWVDSDVNFTGSAGAEDDYYTGLEVGYLTANAPFVSVSELKLVKGFSSAVEEEAENYKLLLPHIAALPVNGDPTPVNVNTATPQVLASFSEDIKFAANTLSRWETSAYEDFPECENIFDLEADTGPQVLENENRNITPYESPTDFVDEAGLTDPDKKVADVAYDVKSNYFQVRIDVEAEGISLSQFALLERDGSGRTKVIYRSRDTL